MGEVIHRPISATGMSLSTLVREVNQALDNIARQATLNYLNGYPQIDAVVLSNTTLPIWIPIDPYIIEQIAVVTSSGTASVTPRIGTTNMGVTGGVPITATTTPTAYDITSANEAVALSNVNLIVSGLGAGAWLTVALKVRRRS